MLRKAGLFEHFHYLGDTARNAAYLAALRKVAHDKVVLDLGCGTGVMTALALQAGARRVIAVDLDPAILQEAEEIARAGGYADRVEFRHGLVKANSLGDADVCVHEVIGNLILDEDAGITLRGVTMPLIPWGFGFRISLLDVSEQNLFVAVERGANKLGQSFTDWYQRKLNNGALLGLKEESPGFSNVRQSYQSQHPFAFRDALEQYSFRFKLDQDYQWLMVRVDGLLRFMDDSWYEMVHPMPCAWTAMVLANSNLRHLKAGQQLDVTVGRTGIGVGLLG